MDAAGPDSTGPDSTGPDSTGPDSTGPDSTDEASPGAFRRPVDSTLGGWVLATVLQTVVVIYFIFIHVILDDRGLIARLVSPSSMLLAWVIVLWLCWQLMRRIPNRWLAFGASALVAWLGTGFVLPL